MSYAQIQIRPRPSAAAELARRGAWADRSWRTLAHVKADADTINAQIEELHARAPSTLYEYRIAPRQQNPPAHLHVPATVAQLGIVLDLTTQSDHTRTTWEAGDVGGMLMCSDADAMDRKPGSAALYLLRTEKPNPSWPKREGVGAGAAQPITLADALDLVWPALNARRASRVLAALEEHNAETVRDVRDEVAAERELTAEEREAWQRLISDAHAQSLERNDRKTNHHDGAQADAGETYERWHKRAPAKVSEVDELPDVIGIYIGRALRIGYRSDKWHKRGSTEDYDHDYTEPGYQPPEVWADRLDLAHAHAIVIVGGNQRITPEGID